MVVILRHNYEAARGRMIWLIYIVYGLFNDAVSSAAYTARHIRMIVKNELGRMWKEAVETHYEVLCGHVCDFRDW